MIICCMNPLLSRISTSVGQDLLGRMPLFPCFLHGNNTSTIPYTGKYAPRQKQAFKLGCADGASQGSRRGSHVYEINTWLWNFGRPQPRVGGLSVVKSEEIRRRSRSETSWRAWKTRQARKRAADEEESTWRDMTFIYHSYTCHISMLIKACIQRNCMMPPPRDACVYAESDLRWQFHGRICSKNATRIKS